MSGRERQLRFERFFSEFLRPLLEGGEVEIARPLPPADLEHFALAVSSDLETERAVYSALHRAASEIAPIRRLPFPDRGTMALAMAAHNLLFLTDPALDRAFSRGARPEILRWADSLIEEAGPPRTRLEVLSRHALVDRLLLLVRDDVQIKNWASTYRFCGRSVPGNVVALPRLRRVRSETSRRDIGMLMSELEESASVDAGAHLERLVKRAAITELFYLREDSPLAFGAVSLSALASDSLSAGVARRMVARGFQLSIVPLGHALRRIHEAESPSEWMATAISFVVRAFLVDASALGGPADLSGPLERHADARLCRCLYALCLEDERLLPWLIPHGKRVLRGQGAADEFSLRTARAMIDSARPSLTCPPSPLREEAHA